MVLLRRIVAEIIDLFVLIAGTAIGVFLAGQLNGMFEESFTLLTWSEICIIVLIPIALQSLFWLEHTTIGKTMVFCEIVSEDQSEVTYWAMLTREYVSKIFSCYLGCLPILIGKKGLHEIVTNSKVQLKLKKLKRGY